MGADGVGEALAVVGTPLVAVGGVIGAVGAPLDVVGGVLALVGVPLDVVGGPPYGDYKALFSSWGALGGGGWALGLICRTVESGIWRAKKVKHGS